MYTFHVPPFTSFLFTLFPPSGNLFTFLLYRRVIKNQCEDKRQLEKEQDYTNGSNKEEDIFGVGGIADRE
jgi:hypothetical protein